MSRKKLDNKLMMIIGGVVAFCFAWELFSGFFLFLVLGVVGALFGLKFLSHKSPAVSQFGRERIDKHIRKTARKVDHHEDGEGGEILRMGLLDSMKFGVLAFMYDKDKKNLRQELANESKSQGNYRKRADLSKTEKIKDTLVRNNSKSRLQGSDNSNMWNNPQQALNNQSPYSSQQYGYSNSQQYNPYGQQQNNQQYNTYGQQPMNQQFDAYGRPIQTQQSYQQFDGYSRQTNNLYGNNQNQHNGQFDIYGNPIIDEYSGYDNSNVYRQDNILNPLYRDETPPDRKQYFKNNNNNFEVEELPKNFGFGSRTNGGMSSEVSTGLRHNRGISNIGNSMNINSFTEEARKSSESGSNFIDDKADTVMQDNKLNSTVQSFKSIKVDDTKRDDSSPDSSIDTDDLFKNIDILDEYHDVKPKETSDKKQDNNLDTTSEHSVISEDMLRDKLKTEGNSPRVETNFNIVSMFDDDIFEG